MELIHINLQVTDIETSIEFYTNELGFEETWSFETSDGKTQNRYVATDNGVELQLSETDGVTELDHGTAWDHLAMKVDDVDAAVERFDPDEVIEEPGDQPAAGARTAFIRDPDGYKVELVEPLE